MVSLNRLFPFVKSTCSVAGYKRDKYHSLIAGFCWKDGSAIKYDGDSVIVMNVACQCVALLETLASVLAGRLAGSSPGPEEAMNLSIWLNFQHVSCVCTVTKDLHTVRTWWHIALQPYIMHALTQPPLTHTDVETQILPKVKMNTHCAHMETVKCFSRATDDTNFNFRTSKSCSTKLSVYFLLWTPIFLESVIFCEQSRLSCPCS